MNEIRIHPLIWVRKHPPTTCSKCGKTIKPGKLLAQEGRQSYCYRCGTARFHDFWKEKMSKYKESRKHEATPRGHKNFSQLPKEAQIILE